MLNDAGEDLKTDFSMKVGQDKLLWRKYTEIKIKLPRKFQTWRATILISMQLQCKGIFLLSVS